MNAAAGCRLPHALNQLQERKPGIVVTMKNVLKFAAVAEATTGLALLLVPTLVASLLIGEEPRGIALPIARVAGIALIGLGVACWPGPPLVGMLAYSGAVAVFLAYLGLTGSFTGTFLWPAVALHLVLTALLGFSLRQAPRE